MKLAIMLGAGQARRSVGRESASETGDNAVAEQTRCILWRQSVPASGQWTVPTLFFWNDVECGLVLVDISPLELTTSKYRNKLLHSAATHTGRATTT